MSKKSSSLPSFVDNERRRVVSSGSHWKRKKFFNSFFPSRPPLHCVQRQPKPDDGGYWKKHTKRKGFPGLPMFEMARNNSSKTINGRASIIFHWQIPRAVDRYVSLQFK